MKRREITARRRNTSPTDATFQITDTKLYLPVVTLSTENDKRLLEQEKKNRRKIDRRGLGLAMSV